jgi:hypothetical protein
MVLKGGANVKKQTGEEGRIVWLAGMPLVLHYSIDSLCAMEIRAGMPLDRLMNHHFNATRLLLWAGLRWNHPKLTVWDAGELIGEHLQRGGTLEDVIDACAEGLRASGLLEGEAKA